MHEQPPSVAIDASLWDERTTGIGLYTRSLVQALEAEEVHVVRVGARQSGEWPRDGMSATTFWLGRLPSLLRSIPQPIFHGVCNFNLPLVRVPGKRFVLTVHDLIPDLLPQTVSFAYRMQFRLWLARSLKVADAVLCDSRSTRDDLIERFHMSGGSVLDGNSPEPDALRERDASLNRPNVDKKQRPSRRLRNSDAHVKGPVRLPLIEVVHLGVDHVDAVPRLDADGNELLQSFNLPETYVLYAGALDARKNIGALLDAVGQLKGQGQPVTLVMQGQRWFGNSSVEKQILSMRGEGFDIRYLGYQPPSVFYEVMRRASVFVFPSRYEGFGLPPLEAMYLGIPVITTRRGALSEICGDSAVFVDPDDSTELAVAIRRLLDSKDERQARAASGRKWAKQFTWKRTGQQTTAVYRALAAGR